MLKANPHKPLLNRKNPPEAQSGFFAIYDGVTE